MISYKLLPRNKYLQSTIRHALCSRLKYSQPTLPRAASTSFQMTDTQQAIVKCFPADNNVRIELVLAGKQRFMSRPKTEPLERTLNRIQIAAAPVPEKKSKRAKGAKGKGGSSSIAVVLYEDVLDGKQVAGTIPNVEAWQPGRMLQVGETRFSILFNPPTAEKLQVYGQPMVGYPLCPTVQVTFSDERDCQWRWYRSGQRSADTAAHDSQGRPPSPRRRSPSPSPHGFGNSHEVSGTEGGFAAWQLLPGADQRVYIPTPEDAGHRLRVECIPTRGSNSSHGDTASGAPMSLETDTVTNGPEQSAAAQRHAHTSTPLAPPSVRVVTYNILADQYASTDYAQQHLFAYCPKQFMVPEYRRPLIMQEILGYNADIICLQEVDEKAFATYFQPLMSYAGFEGHYTNKAGATAEGSAMFCRTARYGVVRRADIPMKSVFASLLAGDDSSRALHAQFLPLLQASPHLVQALQRVSTVAQLAILVPRQPAAAEEGPLCVVNTHLFFHPKASHIRTLHVAAMLAEAHALMDVAGRQLGRTPSLLFCGDLNSDKNDGISGAVELLQNGTLPADHWDWTWGADFRFVKDDDADEGTGEHNTSTSASAIPNSSWGPNGAPSTPAVTGVDVSVPFALRSADGGRYEFTNYVRGYTGLLDYVFYQPERMRAREPLSLPGAAELAGWIPSQRFPSDHISLVFDLDWLPSADSEAEPAEPAGLGRSQESCSGVGGAAVAEVEQPLSSRSAETDVAWTPGSASGGAQTIARGAAAMVVAGSELGQEGGRGGSEAAVPRRGAVLAANERNAAAAAAEALGRGDVVAVPTDTLYGLAACANSKEGVGRLYDIKHRQAHVPLAICVADVPDVERYGMCAHLPQGLLDDLLPGPVTVLLTRRSDAPLCPALNPGVATIGIRVPDSGFMRTVCREHGRAIALTSANISGAASPINIHDFEELWPQCAAVFDGGVIGADRAGSTVVDLSVSNTFRILREGSHPDQVRQVLIKKYSLAERM